MVSDSIFFGSWDELGVKIPYGKINGKFNAICPLCNDLRKPQNKNKKCLTVDLDRQYFKCHNDNCGKYGYIVNRGDRKEYFKPDEILPKDLANPVSLSWVDYFSKRGISASTLRKLKVLTTLYKFPQNDFQESEAVVFPYYYNNTLLFYKYRGINKEFSMSKSPQLIFWNINSVLTDLKKTVKDVIICEGEIDALSWVEAGFERVISVPNGATLSNNSANYQYLDRTIDIFEKIETIYLSTDYDEAGQKLKDDLVRRLGHEKCKIIKLPNGCKDANDVLKLENGKEKLVECFENADWYPISGIRRLDGEVEIKFDERRNGVIKKYKKLGWSPVDDLITFNNGNALTLVSGAPNSAKSQFALEIAIRQSIIHGMKWAIFSNESGEAEDVFEIIFKILTGQRLSSKETWDIPLASNDLYLYMKKFMREHFIIIDDVDLKSLTFTEFLDIVEQLVKKYGVSGAIGDPFNNFTNAFDEHSKMISDSLNTTLTHAKKFCKKYDVHLILVPHPSSLAHTQGMMKSAYSINGASAWVNKPDNILLLNRQIGTSDYKIGLGDDVEVIVEKVKKNFAGRKGQNMLKYHVPTGRFGYINELGTAEFSTYDSLQAVREAQTDKALEGFENDLNDPFDDPFDRPMKPLPQDMPRLKVEDFEQFF